MREDELRALRLESEELRMTQHEMRVKLRKKEWECESRTMERDQFKSSVEKLRIKLNRSEGVSVCVCVVTYVCMYVLV